MLLSCRHNIDPGGVDTAVSQNICQLGNVLFDAVEGPGEELPQVVGKHLAFPDTGGFAQLLHQPPDPAAVERFAVSAHKDRARSDAPALCVIQQDIFQLAWNKNRPGLAFAIDGDLTPAYRLNGEELQFRHSDTCSADRLKNQIELFIFLGSR